MAMILELGTASIELIRVTSEFSNAVLVAVMPYVADVVQKLDLPVPRPLTIQHVTACSIEPTRKWGVEISVEGGWVFAFARGYVRTIQSSHCYTMLQDCSAARSFLKWRLAGSQLGTEGSERVRAIS
jgi:hypothetical protein